MAGRSGLRNRQITGITAPLRDAAQEANEVADYGSIKERWTRVVSSNHADEWAPSAPDALGNPSAAPYAPGPSPSSEQPAWLEPRTLSNGTFIGNGALFEGILTLRGDFRIDTEFRGELETDGTITIEASGSVVGSIRAREVVIRGAVVGNVIAPRQLILEPTGKLHGDIETACLEIQKHALFQGNTSMSQPQTTRRPGAQSTKSEGTASSATPVQL